MLNETAMKIYQYIKEAIENNYPPTVREICKALEIKSTSTVHKYINLLADEGYIEKLDNRNRAIRLKNTYSAVNVPVIEKFTHGTNITADENINGYVSFIPENSSTNPLFAFKMKDNSMADYGILKDDIIIAEQTSCAENGDIAAVLCENGNAAIRILHKEDTGNSEIIGKVTALQRFF